MTTRPVHHCGLLTPPGTGAIAIIRVTGPHPDRFVDMFFQPPNGRRLQNTPRDRLRYGPFVHLREILDEVVVYRTGNEQGSAVEICCHGGIRVVERILEALAEKGATLDLSDQTSPPWMATTRIEREALELLPGARTQGAVKFLAFQRTNTPRWLSETACLCSNDPREAKMRITAFLDRADAASRIIHGANVTLVGPANSGKSTLFNRLVGRDAAIVSPVKGTTRDWVSASIELDGVAVTLIDTAGRHHGGDELERLAMQVSARISSGTDLALLVVDHSKPLPNQLEFFDSIRTLPHSILVCNKCDIPDSYGTSAEADSSERAFGDRVYISAINGNGIADLVEAMAVRIGANRRVQSQPAAFTKRQSEVVRSVLDLLARDPLAAERKIKQELIGGRA